MELTPQKYDLSENIITTSGNIVHRTCSVYGSVNIHLLSHSILKRDCIIRGDLAIIQIGKYGIVESGTVIKPPLKPLSKGITYLPVKIGDYVIIEENCVIVAITIGNYVHIGKNSIISQNCVIKDCCYILADSVVMPNTVIPPFSVVSGNPAKKVAEWPPSSMQLMIDATISYYENYLPNENKKLKFSM